MVIDCKTSSFTFTFLVTILFLLVLNGSYFTIHTGESEINNQNGVYILHVHCNTSNAGVICDVILFLKGNWVILLFKNPNMVFLKKIMKILTALSPSTYIKA